MTAYSNVINKVVETAISGEGFNARTLAPKVYDKIGREDRKRTSIATITRDLRDAANDFAKTAMKAHSEKQIGFNFLKLPGAVAVDDEGSKVKLTMSLSQMEFRKSVERRRSKQTAIGQVADEMELAESVAAPYWKLHPEWTFGRCIEQAEKDATGSAAA
jgi:hypothetical protein